MPNRSLSQYAKCDDLAFAGSPTEIAIFRFPRHSETATVQGSRIITVPPYSTWKTGLYWHEEYVESLRGLEGEAKISIAGVERIYSKDDGIVSFPKSTIDEYRDAIPGPFWFKRFGTHTGLAIVGTAGKVPGFSPWIKEYTLEYFWDVT